MSLKELTIESRIHVGTLACPSLTKLDIHSKIIHTFKQVANGLEELELGICEGPGLGDLWQ